MELSFLELRWEMVFILAAGLVSASLVTFFGLRMFGKNSMEVIAKSAPTPTNTWRGKERRVYPRFPVFGVEAVIMFSGDELEEKEPQSARIIDRSLRGIGLELTQEVKVGQRLQLRLKEWTRNTSWITMEVMNCLPQGKTWRVGCQFVEISPWKVMALFGPPDSD